MKRKHDEDQIYSRATSSCEPDFDKIAKAIGREWTYLGTALGYRQAQLDNLLEIYHGRPWRRNYVMLERWWKAMTSEKDEAETKRDMEELVSKIYFDVESSDVKQKQLQCYIEKWKARDEKYFEPRYFSKTKEILLKNGSVTLIASPGDGKTATCMHLALQMMDTGYKIIPASTIRDLNKCNPTEKTLYVLDDPIGTEMLEKKRMQSWMKQRDVIESCIEKGNTRVIITIRKGLFKEAKHFIQDSFMGKHCIDLSSECNRLNLQEKEGIIGKHKLPLDKVRRHVTEEYFPGFPVLCHLLSLPDVLDSVQIRGADSVIKKQIEELKQSKTHHYCALSLIALFDGIFDKDILLDIEYSQSPTNTAVTNVVSSCGLSSERKTIHKINKSFDVMDEIYVIRDQNGNHRFLHDLIYDAVAGMYGAENILVVMNHFSPAFLRSRIRIEENDVEVRFGQIKLFPKYFSRFAERLSKDIEEGFITDVFTNPSILQVEFQNCLKRCLLKFPNEKRRKILSYQQEEITFNKREMKNALDYAVLSGTPIHWLCKLGMHSFMHDMLETFDNTFLKSLPGDTPPLHFAAGYGHVDTVRLLLQFGVDVNAKSSLRIDGNLSAIGEYYTGFTPLLYACRENHIKVVCCLLENGANPNLVRDHGGSPMLITADKGHHLVIRKLLQHNAEPNICCEHGTSPLYLASQEGHTESVITLLDGGALINKKKPSGFSPISIAVKNGHIDTALRLLNRGANIHTLDNDGNSPLHLAVLERRMEIAKMLIYRGADSQTLLNKAGHSSRSLSLELDGTNLIKILHGLPTGRG